MTISDKFNLLKLHPCSNGLSDRVVRQISDATELVHFEPGDCLQRRGATVDSVSLVVHGRVKLSILDIQGEVVTQRFQGSGGQFGGMAAALAEPVAMECFAEDPTTILKLDYQTVLLLTKEHETFRRNLTQVMAESVRQSLMGNKLAIRPRVVAFCHQSIATRQLAHDTVERLAQFDESVCVLNDSPGWQPIDGVRQRQAIIDGRLMNEEEARALLHEGPGYERLVFDVDTDLQHDQAVRLLEISNLFLWCVTPQNWEASVDRLRRIQESNTAWREKVTIVWLLEQETESPAAPELRELASGDVKISFRESPPTHGSALNHGFERLIHKIRGIKIGLALGGGAARGMAHLGVVKAFEDSGIVIDMIAGTSVGAMTGVIYASGLDAKYTTSRFVHDLRPSWLFRNVPGGDRLYLLYKYRTGQWDPMLRKYLAQKRIEQLPIPFSAVTVDLIAGEPVVRDSGDAVHAILESINLPVVSKPINRDGRALVDGGVINNVPADVLVANGCNFVIAVSVTTKMEREFVGNQSKTPTDNMKSASFIQTLLRTYVVQSRNMRAVGEDPADILIEPDITSFDLTEFTRADEMAELGSQATLDAIPKIKTALAALDRKVFHWS